jgi:hypothetical protein
MTHIVPHDFPFAAGKTLCHLSNLLFLFILRPILSLGPTVMASRRMVLADLSSMTQIALKNAFMITF